MVRYMIYKKNDSQRKQKVIQFSINLEDSKEKTTKFREFLEIFYLIISIQYFFDLFFSFFTGLNKIKWISEIFTLNHLFLMNMNSNINYILIILAVCILLV